MIVNGTYEMLYNVIDLLCGNFIFPSWLGRMLTGVISMQNSITCKVAPGPLELCPLIKPQKDEIGLVHSSS